MIDRSLIGRKLEPQSAMVERGLLSLFLESIGETDPVHLDDSTARAAGYRAAIIPPTFLLCMKIGVLQPAIIMERLGIEVNYGRTFHAEQSFSYLAPVCIGDRIDFAEHVADIYDKKNGELTFIALETVATNQLGEHVATFRLTTVVTN